MNVSACRSFIPQQRLLRKKEKLFLWWRRSRHHKNNILIPPLKGDFFGARQWEVGGGGFAAAPNLVYGAYRKGWRAEAFSSKSCSSVGRPSMAFRSAWTVAL